MYIVQIMFSAFPWEENYLKDSDKGEPNKLVPKDLEVE